MVHETVVASYPTSVVTDAVVGIVTNDVTATLSASVTSGTTSWTVNSTSSLLAGMYLATLGSNGYEIVRISSIDSATTMTVVRAQDGTTAYAHSQSQILKSVLVAKTINQLREEVQAIQTEIGNTGSFNYLKRDGSVTLAGTLNASSARLYDLGSSAAPLRRLYVARLLGYVDINAYGAAPGASAATNKAAFEAALADARTLGGMELRFTQGGAYAWSSVTITPSGNAETLHISGPVPDWGYRTGGGAPYGYQATGGVIIDCSAFDATVSSHAIKLDGTEPNPRFRGVIIENISFRGPFTGTASNWRDTDANLTSFGTLIGLHTESTIRTTIRNCHFFSWRRGFQADIDAHSLSVSNVTIEQCQEGMRLNHGNMVHLDDIAIVGCQVGVYARGGFGSLLITGYMFETGTNALVANGDFTGITMLGFYTESISGGDAVRIGLPYQGSSDGTLGTFIKDVHVIGGSWSGIAGAKVHLGANVQQAWIDIQEGGQGATGTVIDDENNTKLTIRYHGAVVSWNTVYSVGRTSATDSAFTMGLVGETNNRLRLMAGGVLRFGAGGGSAEDTYFSRETAGVLGIRSLTGANPGLRFIDDDVAHGMTDIVPTTVAGVIGTIGSTQGGAQYVGLISDTNTAARLHGYNVGASTTVPIVSVRGSKKSGVSAGNPAATDLLYAIERHDGTQLWNITAGGSVVLRAPAGSNPASFWADADVNHGMSTPIGANDRIVHLGALGSPGGAYLVGAAEDDTSGVRILGLNVGASTTEASVQFRGGKRSGAGPNAANLADTDLAFAFEKFDGTKLAHILGNGDADFSVGYFKIRTVATGSLPAAGATMDGTILIEDVGAGDRNIIIYAGGQRFRIDGGAAF